MMRGTKHSDPAILRFGIFELTPHKHELRRAGVLPNVQEQPSKLLVLVAERSGWNGAPSPESAAHLESDITLPCQPRRANILSVEFSTHDPSESAHGRPMVAETA